MNEFTSFDFRQALDAGCAIRVECACESFEKTFDSFEEFDEARKENDLGVHHEGDWDWAFAYEQATVECPVCGAEGSDTELRGRGATATIVISAGVESSTTDLERDALVGATAPLPERRARFTESVEADAPIRIDCGCGIKSEFSSLGDFFATDDDIEFEYEGDHLGYALAGGKYTVSCPTCDANASVSTLQEIDGVETIVLTLTVGTTCPSCDSPVQDAGFKEGPDAPEIGWEYYECPDCEARMRIERVAN